MHLFRGLSSKLIIPPCVRASVRASPSSGKLKTYGFAPYCLKFQNIIYALYPVAFMHIYAFMHFCVGRHDSSSIRDFCLELGWPLARPPGAGGGLRDWKLKDTNSGPRILTTVLSDD